MQHTQKNTYLEHTGYYLGTLFLIVIVLLNNYQSSFGNVTLSPERVMSGPLIIITLFWIVVTKKIVSLPQNNFLLFLWLIFALIASGLSDVPVWSLKMYIALIIAISYYYLILLFQINPISIFNSKTFFAVAWFFGPILSVLYIMSILNFDLPSFINHWFQEGSGGTRIRATIHEANLFGAFLTLFILMVLAINKTKKLWWWVLLLGLHTSLAFSFSRMPWIAYFFGLFFYLILIHPKTFGFRNVMKYLIITFISLIVLAILFYIVYLNYGHTEIIGRTHSISTRFVMWSLAFESFLEAPFIGNGIFSFSALHPEAPALVGSETHRSAWISNLPLAIIHDTGLIGFVLFFTFLLVLISKAWFTVREESIKGTMEPYHIKIGAALVASSLSLLVASQAIPSHSLGLFWVVLALTSRFVIQSRQRNI